MTLRTMAKILGISPAYLSLLVNGKRPWRGNLEERYEELVNTFVNTPKASTSMTKASEDDFVAEKVTGGAEGIRTPDFLLAKEALSRAELQPHASSGLLSAYSYQYVMDSPGGVKGLKAGGLDAEIISTLATG